MPVARDLCRALTPTESPRGLKHVPSSLLSSGGAKLFVGAGREDDLKRGKPSIDMIIELDSASGTVSRSLATSRPIHNFTVSNDDSKIYAVESRGNSILVIDTASLREIRTLQGIGVTPAFVLTAP